MRVLGDDTREVMKFVDGKRRSFFDGDCNNWSPRVNFACPFTCKLAVRSGYGLLVEPREGVPTRRRRFRNVNATPNVSLDSNATPRAWLNDFCPEGLLLPPGRSQGDWTLVGFGARTIARNWNRNPEDHSWNLSIQRDWPFQSVLEVNTPVAARRISFCPTSR